MQSTPRDLVIRRPWLEIVVAVMAAAAGLAIAFVDSRPGWDDTGVTVFALGLAALGAGFAAGRRPWLWALLVGAWTPLVEIPSSGQAASLVALVVAGLGAAAGVGIRAAGRPERQA